MGTSIEEFDRWVSLIPEDVLSQAWLFPVARNDKVPDVPAGESWKDEKYRLTIEEARSRILSGSNVGVAATGQGLVFFDFDKPEVLKPESFPDTLTIITRNGRVHKHYLNGGVQNADGKGKYAGCGELRAKWKYVLTPGSYVPPDSDASPDADGLYRIVKPMAPTLLRESDLPDELKPTPAVHVVVDLTATTGIRNKYGWALEDIRNRDNKLNELLSNLTPAGYASASEADMATASKLFFWGYEATEVVSIWRTYRPREKLNRDDYVSGTLSKVSVTRTIDEYVDTKHWHPRTGFSLKFEKRERGKPFPSEREELVELEHITQIENPRYLNTPVIVEGIVSSTAFAYAVPSRVKGNWLEYVDKEWVPASGEVEIEPDHPLNMEIAGATSQGKYRSLSRLFPSTKGLRIKDLSHRTVYRFRVRPPVFTLEKRGELIVDEKGFEYQAYGIYVIAEDKIPFPASSLVRLTGKPLPDPKNQKITILVTETEFPDNVEGFDLGALILLSKGFEGKSVEERAEWIFDNFEKYSRIVGRRNLAKATILAYFTPVWIIFNGELQRGWANNLILGDTTTGKSETVRKVIWLLKAGTLITAETASAVGLTGTATQVERGGWTVDWGFLVLSDRRLLAVDGAHKLRMSQWAALAESERSGVVTIAKAAKDSAYARTRQVKIANPIDPDSKRYMTKDLGSFLYPVQATSTFLDLMSVARIDLCVFADSHDVKAVEINVKQSGEYDKRLELLSEALKWAWGENLEIIFSPEAEDKLLDEATKIYDLFFCKSVPLASFDMKWKLARQSAALACLTLSTVDFKRVIVEEDHVNWIVGFLKEEYTNAGLHTLAQESRYEVVTEEDAKELLNIIAIAIKIEEEETKEETAKEIVKFIVLQGRVTRDQLKEKFNLARTSQLVPLLSVLQNEKLVKVGRGFYPTKRLIETYRILGHIGQIGHVKIDIPYENAKLMSSKLTQTTQEKGEETRIAEGDIDSEVSKVTNVTKNTVDAPDEGDLDWDELFKPIEDAEDETPRLQKNLEKVLDIFQEEGREQSEETLLALLKDPHGIGEADGRKLLSRLKEDGLIFQPEGKKGWWRA